MTILNDIELHRLIRVDNLIEPYDDHRERHQFVNPASIDVHCGNELLKETPNGELTKMPIPRAGIQFKPGEFALVPTLEYFNVPNGYAMDLRLKSSSARQGWQHAMAFWVDPGWRGVLTMEIYNARHYETLTLKAGQRFAQVIVHKLIGPSEKPYIGKYAGALKVEGAKP